MPPPSSLFADAFDVPPSTAAFIRALPKTETHLHIEGALPLALLREVAPDEYGPSLPSWRSDFRYPDFATFEAELIGMASRYYTSPERYHDAARHVFRTLVEEQNVRYVETSFASGMVEFNRIDATAVAEAIHAAAEGLVEVRVFMGIHHTGYHEGTASWIDRSVGNPHLDGLDLHGPETDPLGAWATTLWRRARDAGKTTKAHAGEFDGPSFVQRVVDNLGVRRVQHGVRSIEDPRLVERLASEDVTLDVCPISNVKLAVVSSYDAHPIRRLLESGVRCTVSTDDPLIFGNTLFDEYAMLASRLGFTHADLARVAANGFRTVIGDPEFARPHLREIERLADGTG